MWHWLPGTVDQNNCHLTWVPVFLFAGHTYMLSTVHLVGPTIGLWCCKWIRDHLAIVLKMFCLTECMIHMQWQKVHHSDIWVCPIRVGFAPLQLIHVGPHQESSVDQKWDISFYIACCRIKTLIMCLQNCCDVVIWNIYWICDFLNLDVFSFCRYHAIHRDVYKWFDISFDKFGRTSSPQQTEVCQSIFKKLLDNNWLSENTMQQACNLLSVYLTFLNNCYY